MTLPAVSVVVPTADRPDELARCLAALSGLDYPRERLEVVVADDGGTGEVGAPAGLDVRVVRGGERRGPGAARNAAARVAKGELLAFTDDDCLPDRGWLRALAAATDGAEAAVGGRTVNALTANPYSEASQHVHDLVYAHYNRDHAAARLLASNNLAVPREGFLAVGGFDEGFRFASEDRDLCDRWRASGRPLRFAPEAVVRHAHDLDLRGFVAQHVAYGRGAARFHRARSARGTGRLIDEAAFHFDPALWLRTLRLRPLRRAARTAALLTLWQAANATGYVLERRRG